MPGGRPTKYSDKIAKAICYAIATSKNGLQRICEERESFPSYKVVFDWLNDERKTEFRKLYAQARVVQQEFLGQEMIDITDNASRDAEAFVGGNHVQRARLQVETRKWLMSKLAPKKYGDKLDITTDGEKINQPPLNLSTLSDEELKTFHALSIKAATGSGTK